MNKLLIVLISLLSIGACQLGRVADAEPEPTSTMIVAQFSTAEPTLTLSPSPDLSYLLTPSPTVTPTPTEVVVVEPTPTQSVEDTPTLEPTLTPEPLPTATPVPPTEPPVSEVPAEAKGDSPTEVSKTDFVLRFVRMRTNEENSWDGKLNDVCGSDHSI